MWSTWCVFPPYIQTSNAPYGDGGAINGWVDWTGPGEAFRGVCGTAFHCEQHLPTAGGQARTMFSVDPFRDRAVVGGTLNFHGEGVVW